MEIENKQELADKTSQGRGLSLQTKFMLWVGPALLFCCLAAAYAVYWHEKRLLEEAAVSESRLVMTAVESARSYVRDELRPRMYEVLGQEAFVMEAMSTSYISRAVMDRFKGALPDYLWRRVAPNARNPESEPLPFELKMIDHFKSRPNENHWQGIVKIEGRSSFIHMRPEYFKESCLHCHGDPQDAPKALLDIYGSERGFGHKAGEIAGVSGVSIPVDVALAKIKDRATAVFGTGVLIVSLLFVVIIFLFNRVVIQSLRDLLDVFRQGLRGEEELELLKTAASKDEIDDLKAAAENMTGHLKDARFKLEKYAGNLEIMVADRTKALQASEKSLQEKVTARNHELGALNKVAELITAAERLETVLPQILREVLDLIPAEGAAIYLLQEEPARLVLSWRENADNLDVKVILQEGLNNNTKNSNVKDLPTAMAEAVRGRMSLFPCKRNGPCLNAPLICRGQVLGVMAFVGVDFSEITSETRELLLSIGQQIGITIESMQNIEKLTASKDLLQSVFNGITDMVILLDRNMKIKMVNKAHLDYFGVTEDEVLRLNCRKEKICIACPFLNCDLEKAFTEKKPFTEELTGPEGNVFRMSYFPILDEKGEVDSIVRFARDVTAEKEVERRIQQTEKLASLGQLSAGVAHEINNPLGVILCHTDLLKSQLADFPQGFKDASTVEKHARNCQRIVADLLNFARGHDTERQPAEFNRTIEEVVQIVRPQFKRRRCELETEFEEGLPNLNLDVDRMKQVYLNLFMNSLHALERGGKARIKTKKSDDGKSAIIEFWDNGSGIPKEIRDKIFDPFFSTKKTGEGTGLGLSVSYGIIHDHGGTISVESEPGQGTRFIITLPIDESR